MCTNYHLVHLEAHQHRVWDQLFRGTGMVPYRTEHQDLRSVLLRKQSPNSKVGHLSLPGWSTSKSVTGSLWVLVWTASTLPQLEICWVLYLCTTSLILRADSRMTFRFCFLCGDLRCWSARMRSQVSELCIKYIVSIITVRKIAPASRSSRIRLRPVTHKDCSSFKRALLKRSALKGPPKWWSAFIISSKRSKRKVKILNRLLMDSWKGRRYCEAFQI